MTSSIHRFWNTRNMASGKLYTGGLFSFITIHGDHLYCGMLDGLIKMWNLAVGCYHSHIRTSLVMTMIILMTSLVHPDITSSSIAPRSPL